MQTVENDAGDDHEHNEDDDVDDHNDYDYNLQL
jgi:hypothetical protein